MKFIHVADIHASRDRLQETLTVLTTLCREVDKDTDFIVFAGDFWDSTITATKGSGYTDIIQRVKVLSELTKLYFVYGTPSHEPDGSLDVFNLLDNCEVFRHNTIVEEDNCDILFMPEPRRSDYITNTVEATDKAIGKEISLWIKNFKEKNTDKPKIIVYHGEVGGAKYQNGMDVSPTIAIPQTLLKSTESAYYAFGHIHSPQEVFKNAWYSGSAAPKNYGESHNGGFNVIEIENGKTKVERRFFNLPTFITEKITFEESADFVSKNVVENGFENKNLRLIISCTKEQRKLLNAKELQENIKAKGNTVSVKIETELLDTDSTVKSEVVQKKSLVEKMIAYAKERGLKIPKGTKEKLQNIEGDTQIKSSYPQHSFELLSLSLRGAIGIRDGMQKENFDINFENLEDGVVCLVGHNGRGKTTCVENCHPYPSMLTREGTLKEHFYLKDSHRILVYKDEHNLYYRITMLINGASKNGSTQYFVETSKDKEEWKPLPNIDGSLDSYKRWVESTFGSIDVFLRTAFFAKEQTKGVADISATTKSERMELLSKLAGSNYLKGISVLAREKKKEVERKIEKIDSELEAYSRFEDTIEENECDIEDWKDEIEELKTTIPASEKKVEKLKVRNAEYQTSLALNKTNMELYGQYKKEYDDKKERLDILATAIKNKDLFTDVSKSEETIKGLKSFIAELEKKQNDRKSVLSATIEELSGLNKEVSNLKVEISNLESEGKILVSQIADIDEVCPTCGAPLSEHKKLELKNHVASSEIKLSEIKEQLSSLKKEYDNKKKNIDNVDIVAELKKEIEENEIELNRYGTKLAECINIYNGYDSIYKEQTFEDSSKEYDELKSELDSLQKRMDKVNTFKKNEDVSEKLKDAEKKLRENLKHKAELEAMIRSAEKENERYKKKLEKTEENKKKKQKLLEDVAAYEFIDDAFSNNGIPAIELRESAPEIADVANSILHESYGNKFDIRFGSTSDIKTKRKADEDFNIIVYDSENGDEKTIDTVSSGERIWIKQALFYAFSIVQMNRTGFNFRVRLIDESDGSLDGTLRPKYLKMVQSAHKIAQSRVTVLITHSQEIKDIAEQIIEL